MTANGNSFCLASKKKKRGKKREVAQETATSVGYPGRHHRVLSNFLRKKEEGEGRNQGKAIRSSEDIFPFSHRRERGGRVRETKGDP